MDLGGAYAKATRARAPQARQCVDPFHLVKLANEAVDKARLGLEPCPPRRRRRPADRWAALRHRPGRPAGQTHPLGAAQRPRHLTDHQLDTLHELRRNRRALPLLATQRRLRDLYRLADPADAAAHLDWWLAWACRSRIPAFVTLPRPSARHRDRILAAVELGLSNSKLEGLNSKIRLINHRGYGHHSAAAIIAMIYLCCGGITITLPTQR